MLYGCDLSQIRFLQGTTSLAFVLMYHIKLWKEIKTVQKLYENKILTKNSLKMISTFEKYVVRCDESFDRHAEILNRYFTVKGIKMSWKCLSLGKVKDTGKN